MPQRKEDRLLQGFAEAAGLLVRGGATPSVLAEVMRALGDAARVDRAYLFENVDLPGGVRGMSQRVEWVRGGVSPQIDNPELQGLPYAEVMEEDWVRELESSRSAVRRVRDVTGRGHAILSSQGVKSLVFAPIFASGRFWGFVGFDDCTTERVWTVAERSILTGAAALIGAHVAWRHSEAERRRGEARFRALVEGTTDCIWELDAEGRYSYVSPAFLELTGRRPEEAIGTLPSAVQDPDEAERLRKVLGEVARSSEPVHFHRTLVRHERGHEIVVELTVSPFHGEDGAFQGWRGTARDVTERYRDEQLQAALFEISEASGAASDLDELYRRVHGVLSGLMPARNMYIALWDEETALLSFPYHVDEVDPPPAPRRRGRGLTEYVLRTGRTLLASPDECDALYTSGEVELIGASSVDWLGAPLRTVDETVGVLAVQSYEEGVRYRDIDARTLEFVSTQVAMAIQRRRSEDHRQRIVASLEEAQAVAHVGSWEYYPAQEPFLLVSAETLRIFDFPLEPSRRPPRDFLERIHPEDGAALARLSRTALATGEGFDLDVRVGGRIVHGRARVIRSDEGRVQRLLGVVHDITERKRDEQRLVEATDEMRASIAALEERNRGITLLSEMGRLLQACRTRDEAHAIAGRLAPRLFPGSIGALLALDRGSGSLRSAAAWGVPPPPGPFGRDDCWALRLLRPHATSSAADELRCAHLGDGAAAFSLCVPLSAQGQPLGVLSIERHAPVPPDRAEALGGLAATAAEQISLALANLELREILREQAIRDPLTGLFNRRYLEDALEREVRRADRKGHQLGLLMIDLDHFKRFNDTHGHDAGDALLRAFGSFLRSRVRAADVACRYGGEEFVVLLPECGDVDAARRAEELRSRVEGIQVPVAGESSAGVTLSVGGAVYPRHAPSGRELLRVADEALYRAKAEGRDRVVMVAST